MRGVVAGLAALSAGLLALSLTQLGPSPAPGVLGLVALVAMIGLELTAVPLGFGFFSPSAGYCLALVGRLGPAWTWLGTAAALALRSLLRGSPNPSLRPMEGAVDLVCAGLLVWSVSWLGPYSLPVVLVVALLLPVVLFARLAPDSLGSRARAALAAETVALLALGQLGAVGISQPVSLLLLLVWPALRSSAGNRLEQVERSHSELKIRQGQRGLQRQARHLEVEQERVEHRQRNLESRAEALLMLERLSLEAGDSETALQQVLEVIAARLPAASCGLYRPTETGFEGVVGRGQRRCQGTIVAESWTSARSLLWRQGTLTEAAWPIPGWGVLWVATEVELAPDTVELLETFLRFAALALQRAAAQDQLLYALGVEAGLREQLSLAVDRLNRMLEAAVELTAEDPGQAVEEMLALASKLAGGARVGATTRWGDHGAPAGGTEYQLGEYGSLWVDAPHDYYLELWAYLVASWLDRLQVQGQLAQAGKMAAIGQLAAGVAHELNTPLGAVKIALKRAQQTVESHPERALASLSTSLKAVDQMSAIISKLLYYARQSGRGSVPTVLSTLVRDTLDLVGPTLEQDGLTVETELTDVTVSIDPGQIQQVLMNLLMNARDAVLATGSRAPIRVSVTLSSESVGGPGSPGSVGSASGSAGSVGSAAGSPGSVGAGSAGFVGSASGSAGSVGLAAGSAGSVESAAGSAGSVGSAPGSAGSVGSAPASSGSAGSASGSAGSVGSAAGSAGSPSARAGSEAKSGGALTPGSSGVDTASAGGTATRSGWARLTVEDRGAGIPPEIVRRIFEPFFTTKEVGQGTGLGLAISAEIAADHGGSLTCQPARPQGTCFILELPL